MDAVQLLERVAEPSGWSPGALALQRYWPPGTQAVEALTATGCRWPMGEVADEGFRFCGVSRVKRSYCAAHYRLAYGGAGR